MKKSFTWLFSLVVLLGLFSIQASAFIPADGISEDEVWPLDGTSPAYSKITDKLEITYSEDVVASTGSIRLTLAEDGTVVAIIKATSTRVTYSGGTVMVDVSSYLDELTTYNVCVDADAFKTAADGTPSITIGYCSTPDAVVEKSASATSTWEFTTGDYTGPTLEDVYPEDGSTVDDNTIDLVLEFDDLSMGYEVDTDGIQEGAGNITVYKADGNVWDLITLDFGAGGNAELVDGVLTVSGVRQLEDLVEYQVTIDAGVVTDAGFTDDGTKNDYAGSMDRTDWTFSTEDFTAPTFKIKKSNVSNDSFDVIVETNEDGTAYGVVYLATADEPTVAEVRDASEVDVKDSDDADVTGGAATLSFSGLEEETDYIAYVIVDNDDTEGTVVKEVEVTTGETVAPVLDYVTYVYDDDSDMESVSSNVVDVNDDVELDLEMIVLEFDEDIVLGAGNLIIKRVSDNSVFATIPSTEMEVETDEDAADHNWIEIPVTGLENNVEYYVTIPNTLVDDVYGNSYPGISSNTGWRFTSSDDIAPTYTVSPAHLSTDVEPDVEIVITFDELVDVGSGDFLLYGPDDDLDDGDDGYDFSYDEDDNDGKFTVVTLTPDDPLPSGKMVRVIVEEDNIDDLDGNAISTDDYNSTVFFVKDYEGPVIKKWDPTSELSSATKAIKIEYTEGIYLLGGTEITATNLYTIVTVKKDDENGANVAVNLAISDNKKVITITPATAWTSGADYYVAISSDVEDAAGNAYDDTDPDLRNNTYTVKDLIAETVEINVDGDEIATTDAITIKFKTETRTGGKVFYKTWEDYAIGLMDKIIVLKEGSADGPDVPFTVSTADAITFTISAALDGNKTYYIGVGPSTKDAAGNVNVPYFTTFSTLYEGEAKAVTFTPKNKAKEVAVDADVMVAFNVDIELVDGTTYAATPITIDDGSVVTDVDYADLDVDGDMLTIDHADFDENVTITIDIPTGLVLNKNTGANPYTGGSWYFNTIDTEFEVVALNTDDATDVAIDEKLKITFGEDAELGSGNIDIKNFNTDAIVERIAVTSDQVSIKDEVVTITPSADFKYDTKYYVEVDAGAFMDEFGNENAAIFGKGTVGLYDWVFSTEDPALEITKVTPKDGTDKVGLGSSIVVEFNRLIAFGTTGSIGYIEDDMEGGLSPQVYPIGSSNLSISGKTLTITHTDKDFPEDSRIWLYIEADAVTVAGDATNMLAEDVNGTSTFTSMFYTGDENPPIPTFDPEDYDDTDPVYVDVDVNITITFDENIYHKADGTTFTSGDITDDGIFELYKADGAGDPMGSPIDFVGSISGKVVTMNPDVDLDEYTMYVVVINNDADGVVDNLDHEVPYTLSQFMTTDLTAPTVTVENVTGGEEIFDFDVTVDDVNADKFYYWWRVKSADTGPSAEDIMSLGEDEGVADGVLENIEVDGLEPSTTYQIFYVAIDDFDNVSDVEVVEATTDDTVAPMLVSSDPASGDVDVDIDGGEIEIELTFDEAVVAGTGNIVVRETNTQTILGIYDASTQLTAGDEDEILILTLTGIPNDNDVMEMYIEMPAGSVMDEADTPNEFAGIFGANAIYITTEDNEIPEVELKDDELSTTDNIVLEFSEDVQPGTGRVILYLEDTDVEDAVEVFEASDVTFDGDMVTIDPTDDLENDATYYVVVEDDFALDMSSNENGNEETELSLTVDVNVAPYPTDVYLSADNWYSLDPFETPDAVDKFWYYFDIDFSEPIYLEVDGIRTNILLITDSYIKANNILTIVDMDGNPVDFTFNQCCEDDFTFYINSDLLDNNEYTLTIQGLMDSDGLVMEPWVFTIPTTDGIMPTAMFDPEDDEEDVDPNAVLTITFNEQIYHWTNDGDPFFYEPFDNENIDDVVFLRDDFGDDIDFDATFDGVSVITITPDEPLESGMWYRYGFDDDEVVDADNQSATGDDYAWFQVADIEAPEFDLADVEPAKGAVNVDLDADMWVDFSEDVEVSTGSVIIRNLDGTFAETIGAEGLSIDEDKPWRLWIEHTDFAIDATYFVELQEGVVVDGAGNPNAAYVDDENGWIFTTGDSYPIEAMVSPMGSNQPLLVDLKLTFNKNVMLNSATAWGYRMAIYKADGTAIKQVEASDLVIINNVVTLANVQLEPNTDYYARVEPNAFKDASGNKFAGIMDNSWEFSTVDNLSPELVALSPADNSTLVDPATSFSMWFNREIAIGTGMIEVRTFADGELVEAVDVTTAMVDTTMLTFNLAAPLAANTAYYVLVPAGAVTNTEVGLDPYAGINNTYTWNFSTGDVVVVPELTEWTPQDTIADNHPTFVMTFADDVMLSTTMGYLTVTEMDSTDASLEIEITADMIVGNVVTVTYVYDTLVGGLKRNTTYVVNVDGGVLENAEGNAFAGVSGTTAWTFTTGPDWATSVKPPVALDEFKVYPNPFNERIMIDNNDKLTRVVIHNIAGQRVIDLEYPSHEIRTTDLVSGVYLVSLITEDGIAKTERIVKR